MPTAPPSLFQWHPSNYFGALFGCTAWFFAAAWVLLRRDPVNALAFVVAATTIWLICSLLWALRARARISPALGSCLMIATCFILAIPMALFTHARGNLAPQFPPMRVDLLEFLASLLIYPALLIFLYMCHCRMRRALASPS